MKRPKCLCLHNNNDDDDEEINYTIRSDNIIIVNHK